MAKGKAAKRPQKPAGTGANLGFEQKLWSAANRLLILLVLCALIPLWDPWACRPPAGGSALLGIRIATIQVHASIRPLQLKRAVSFSDTMTRIEPRHVDQPAQHADS
jgi:hypothetical protein